MSNNSKEYCPIEDMIMRRRSHVNTVQNKSFNKKIQYNRSCILKKPVRLFCLTILIGGSVMAWGMGYKGVTKGLTHQSEQSSVLSQDDVNKITRLIDAELYANIERYQNFEGLSPRRAVDYALYDVWKNHDVDYEKNPSEEARISLMHITQRGKQANRMLLSNIVGDRNPFLEMLHNELKEKSEQSVLMKQKYYFKHFKSNNIMTR